MISIGNTLKEARNKKTLSYDEIHAKIKIHPRVLQLLEEEKFDKLPSPLFAKSFLKSYAEFLDINPEEMLQVYERSGAKDPEQTIYIKPAEARSESFDFQKMFVAAPFLILAVFIITGGFYYFSTAATKKINSSRPPRLVGDVSEKVSTLKPASKKIALAPAKAAEAPKEAAVKKPDDRLRSVEAENFPVIDKKTPIDFELKAVDVVWVAVTVDGKVLFQGILKKGTVESWTADETIEIWTGNAASMLLSVNKTSIGSPGKGMIRRLQISRDGVRILSKENR